MTAGNRILRYVIYAAWSVLMTALTYVLGSVSLRALRRQGGRAWFWPTSVVLAGGLFFTQNYWLAISFLSLVLIVGLFAEVEELGFGFASASFFTVLINAMIAGGLFAIWVSRTGSGWKALLLDRLQTALKPLQQISPKLEINYADVLTQAPSIVLILWLVALYASVLLESRLSGGSGASRMRKQLTEFRVHDIVVWCFILALLGAFGQTKQAVIYALSVNALNVCVLLFFFQGVAVVGRFFDAMKMGFFWQFLFMILIVVHLFLFVSLLGLMDHWIDFRDRMSKRGQELKSETKQN